MSTRRGPRGLARAKEVGERVFLRILRTDDAVELRALEKASWSFLRPWFPRRPRDMVPYDEAKMRDLRSRTRKGLLWPLLICSMEDGAILGRVNLGEIVRGPFQNAFVGYWIGAEHTRQGAMSEALPLALRSAFRELKLHRVEANIMPHNRASLAVVESSGFRKEGVSPHYLKIAGKWQTHERWAITVEDWRALGK